MTAIVRTVAYLGLEARGVEVQVQLIAGLPAFNVVGLGDKAVAESRERVRGAIASMGLALPPKRIVVNLSPADLPKEGAHFDLPIALALLGAMGIVDVEALSDYLVVGELALDGRIAPSPGVLLAALHAGEQGLGLICPAAQGSEAAWAGSIEVLAAPDLLALINHFKGHGLLGAPTPGEVEPAGAGPDLRQAKGQEVAKRALEVAAAGGHNLLRYGQPTLARMMTWMPSYTYAGPALNRAKGAVSSGSGTTAANMRLGTAGTWSKSWSMRVFQRSRDGMPTWERSAGSLRTWKLGIIQTGWCC